jgi:mannose-6-phosphate isomerase
MPNNGPFGEAWLLSDRHEHASVVANGAFKGQTLPQIMAHSRIELMGRIAQRFPRFPLLLKFLDARQMLSVQVHPGYTDGGRVPSSPQAKTEAWVVLEAGPMSRVYAGLTPGSTVEAVRVAAAGGSLPALLNLISPKVGDAIFIPAGTVHSLGDDVVVFEIQQNRDTTFRLYDWDHIDNNTGKPRALQVDQALACIDVTSSGAGRIDPVIEIKASPKRETLFDCEFFRLRRFCGSVPFEVGERGMPRVLVCLDGVGRIEYDGVAYSICKGEVWLLPAAVGTLVFQPNPAVTLLEASIPEPPYNSAERML